jgi:catechol 2,3-dioxygenase-like lactoylglutathione lyase family enzyme
MSVVGLDHVQLAMPFGGDAVARHFYVGILGLTEVEVPPQLAPIGAIWFEAKGTVVHCSPELQFKPPEKAHPGFVVADLSAMEEKLKAYGATIKSGSPSSVMRRIYTADPFGNVIELIQDGQGFAQRSAIASAG